MSSTNRLTRSEWLLTLLAAFTVALAPCASAYTGASLERIVSHPIVVPVSGAAGESELVVVEPPDEAGGSVARAELPPPATGPSPTVGAPYRVHSASLVEVFNEDFEGAWPVAPWGRGWFTGYAPNLAFGKTSVHAASGSSSAWAVAAGPSAPPPGAQAPANSGTYMRAGPFDFTSVTSAQLSFSILGNMGPTEELRLYFSESSSTVSGPYLHGTYSNGVQNRITVDAASWNGTADLRGRPAVWFWFAYFSGTGSPRNGAYLDAIRLEVDTSSGACTGSDPMAPVPEGVSRFTSGGDVFYPCGAEVWLGLDPVYLRWSDKGAAAYEWQLFEEACLGTPVASGETSDTYDTVHDLPPGRYCFRVRAIYIGTFSTFASCWSTCCCFVVREACTASPDAVPVPEGIRERLSWEDLIFPCGSEATVGTVNLAMLWSETGAVNYEWQLFAEGCERTPLMTGETQATSAAVPGSLPPGRYCFRVRGIYYGTEHSVASCWSSCCCFTVGASCSLGAPGGVIVTGPNGAVTCGSGTPVGTNIPMLSWDTVSGATGYDVELYAGSCTGTRVAAQTVTGRAVTIGPLSPGTYCFRVRARQAAPAGCEGGCEPCLGPWAACTFVIAEPCTLAAPVGQRTGGRSCTGEGPVVLDASEPVVLAWDAVPQATEYEVEVTASCGGAVIFTTVVATTTLTLPASVSLVPDETYTWRCRPRRPTPAGCVGPWTPCCSFRRRSACQPLPAPVPSTTAGQACGSVVITANERPALEWTTVTGATGYDWEIARECGGTPVDMGSTAGNAANSAMPSRFLASGGYWWRVRSRGDGRVVCTGPWSPCCGCSVREPAGACRVRLGYDYFVVGAANTGGINGSRWAADLELTNYGDSPTTVEIALLPQGKNSLAAEVVRTEALAAGAVVTLQNVVSLLDAGGTVANASLGIRVLGDAAAIGVTARAYNTKPGGGGAGTFGTWLPVVTAARGASYLTTHVLSGLRHSPDLGTGSRAHIGMQNLGVLTARVRVRLFAGAGAPVGEKIVDLRAFEYRLLLNVFGSNSVPGGYATVVVETPGGLVFPWANVIDNASGDPMIVTGSTAHAGGTGFCGQAVVWARNPCTGACEMFGTPCEVPAGWEQCDPAMECDWPWTYRLRDPVCGECREFFGCPFQLPNWPSCG